MTVSSSRAKEREGLSIYAHVYRTDTWDLTGCARVSGRAMDSACVPEFRDDKRAA